MSTTYQTVQKDQTDLRNVIFEFIASKKSAQILRFIITSNQTRIHNTEPQGVTSGNIPFVNNSKGRAVGINKIGRPHIPSIATCP